MKKLVITSAIALACVGAYAQGKVQFKNDTLHLVYFTTDSAKLATGDETLAGKGTQVNGAGTLSGQSLVAELWYGTSSSTLSKLSSTTFASSGTPGTFTSANVVLPTTGTGSGVVGNNYFQVKVYSGSSYDNANVSASGLYSGASSIFQAASSTTPSYYSLVQLTTPASSTWAAGTFDMSYIGAGAKGAIELVYHPVPEPSTFALAGLGAAAMLIFRRRN